MLTNADSLPNKMIELRDRLKTTKRQPDIIAITEVKPKNSRYTLSQVDYKLDGYDAISCNLDCDVGRGLLIYAKTELNALSYDIDVDFSEHSFIQIRVLNNQMLTIGCVYRSPHSADSNNEKLNNMIHKLDNVRSPYKILIGDFNYGKINWESGTATTPSEAAFVNSLKDVYMTQHVSEPTRGRDGQQPSILDLIISNDPDIVSNIIYESPLGRSDHACVLFDINCSTINKHQNKKIYLYDKGDYTSMAAD